jgi:phosphoglycerol transferase MdoB-like AlkP superfamily enzyme
MINLLKKLLLPSLKSYKNNDSRKINNLNVLLINLLLFLFLNVILRIFFLYKQSYDIAFSISEILKLFFIGATFDIIFFSYFLLIPTLYSILSYSISHRPINRIIVKSYYLLMVFIILFGFVSEIIFWDEFQSRFNFIAVDYLIYTTEVINNIVESYPVYKVLLLIMILAIMIFIFVNKKFNFYQSKVEKLLFFRARLPIILSVLGLIAIDLSLIDSEKNTEISQNQYINEIAKNGPYQLFSAYRNNEINFSQLYQNIEQKDALNKVRSIIAKQDKYNKFLNNQDLSRLINRPQSKNGEKKYNIMLVVEESLSADFMEYFGNKDNITPNLDKLAKESLFFTNLKATGTRTVRGLEAISLSIPPTPGNSIVRRKNNDNLFNIASPLKLRGYQAKFIYGGDGYFDNMNDFFFNNGFEIVDRGKFDKEEISFSNAWGVADEDLFDRTIKEADKSYNNNKNFINLILTTSNHRPFTYPDGKIDIASKTNRSGAVKYADYAIGKFIEKAKGKKVV